MQIQLDTFEERRDSEGFEIWRNAMKIYVYFYHQIVESEIKFEQDAKKANDLKAGKSKKRTTEAINLSDSV